MVSLSFARLTRVYLLAYHASRPSGGCAASRLLGMTQPPKTSAASSAGKPIAPDDRARLDQVFMQVMLDTQAQVQQSRPVQAGNLAAMFHKEQVSEALQGCAMLIAGWNQNRIDEAGTLRATAGAPGAGVAGTGRAHREAGSHRRARRTEAQVSSGLLDRSSIEVLKCAVFVNRGACQPASAAASTLA